MAVVSGTSGDVMIGASTIIECTKWKFSAKSNNGAWASNSSSGYKKRVAGVKDGSGSVEGKNDTTDSAHLHLYEGREVTLKLYTVASSKYYSIPAIISGFDIDVDMDSGDPQGWTATFETNGAWTPPT